MPAANSVASKGRIRIEALLRQSRSLAARFALKLGCTVTITSVLATPKNPNAEHLFSTTYNRLPKRVLVTVQKPGFQAAFGSQTPVGSFVPFARSCVSRNLCRVPRLTLIASAISRMDLPERWRLSARSRLKSSLRRPSCSPFRLAVVVRIAICTTA